MYLRTAATAPTATAIGLTGSHPRGCAACLPDAGRSDAADAFKKHWKLSSRSPLRSPRRNSPVSCVGTVFGSWQRCLRRFAARPGSSEHHRCFGRGDRLSLLGPGVEPVAAAAIRDAGNGGSHFPRTGAVTATGSVAVIKANWIDQLDGGVALGEVAQFVGEAGAAVALQQTGGTPKLR